MEKNRFDKAAAEAAAKAEKEKYDKIGPGFDGRLTNPAGPGYDQNLIDKGKHWDKDAILQAAKDEKNRMDKIGPGHDDRLK